jgi:predicted O-methyltransferase YrrM
MTNPIDQAHCYLIYGLACSLKPTSILELGYGEGSSSRALRAAMHFNEIPCRYVVVDDWRAHGGQIPFELNKAEVFSMTEEAFYNGPAKGESFDLILSDADHEHSDGWFEQSLSILRSPGLLIYHDVTNPNHPNLATLAQRAMTAHYDILLFNKSSRAGEQCERGLLVISKA